jgi:hypothetical protein
MDLGVASPNPKFGLFFFLRKWIKCGELFPQDQPWDIG